MEFKIKAIDKLLIGYILLILLLTLVACRTKKVENTKTHTDSVVKETFLIKDSTNTKTIFEYETIYDTVRKEYTTHIKRLIVQESQNKSLQGTKDTKVIKDTKTHTKELTKANNGLSNHLLVVLLVGMFFIGWYVRK